MIEIKAEVNMEDNKVDISTELDGIGAALIDEAIAIVNNLYDSLAENGIERLFVLGTLDTVMGWMRDGKSSKRDAEAGENLA